MRMERLKQWVRLGLVAGCTMAVGRPMQAQKGNGLRVYFADVEGGQATLLVTPGGESLLIDAGWPGSNGRDADRIVAMCRKAGIGKIDNLLLTHFHVDHAGGVAQLVAKIPVGRVIDHGDNTETSDPGTLRSWAAYQKVQAENHISRLTVKPGDILPIKGVRAEVVTADGAVIDKPLTGGGAGSRNAVCATSPEKEPENSENDKSVGLMITFGKTRLLDLGDLTWAKERPLMCPVDKLGQVDVYVVSHHGFDRSGSPALMAAIRPRLAVMDNGGHKGDDAGAWTIIEGSPRIKDLWQIHAGEAAGAHNVQAERIANLVGPDAGHGLDLVAERDGSLAVTNERTGETVRYAAPR